VGTLGINNKLRKKKGCSYIISIRKRKEKENEDEEEKDRGMF